MRPLFSALLVALLALTHVGSAVHYALVEHAIADDGALIHVSEDAGVAEPNSISADAAITRLPSAGCAVSALQRQAHEMPGLARALTTITAAVDVSPASFRRAADRGETYRTAPKMGPPV